MTAAALAVVLRWVLYRDRFLGTIIAAGVSIRLIASLTLFIISYFHLPIATELHGRQGLWFFALDAESYLIEATRVAASGLMNTGEPVMTGASPAYVQLLAIFVWFMGGTALVSLPLNLCAYTLASLVIFVWGRALPDGRKASAFALLALAAFPSGVLWSTAPLKDTAFAALIVLFAGGAAAWSFASAGAIRRPLAGVAGATVALAVAIFMVAGIRWYFAVTMLAALVPFTLVTWLRSSRPRLIIPASVATLLIAALSFRLGAVADLPLDPNRPLAPFDGVTTDLVSAVQSRLETSRRGFISTGGSTAMVATASAPEREAAVSAAGTSGTGSATPDGAIARTSSEAAVPSLPLQPGAFGVRGEPYRLPGQASTRATKILNLSPGGLAHRSGLRIGDIVTTFNGQPVPPQALINQHVLLTPRGQTFTLGVIRDGVLFDLPVTVDVELLQPHLRPRVATGVATEAPETLTTWQPWRTGLTAMFIPTSLQRLFGLDVVGGGRGLLAVTDIDTLFFDAVLGWAFFSTIFRRASYRSATFVLLLALTVAIALPMIYTVTNFGTLFRLRGMVLVTAALLPLAALSWRSSRAG